MSHASSGWFNIPLKEQRLSEICDNENLLNFEIISKKKKKSDLSSHENRSTEFSGVFWNSTKSQDDILILLCI